MDLQDIGISVPTLRLAYHVLSATGDAKETEKGKIQEAILWTYKKYKTHKEIELDPLYTWNKNYQNIFVKFNTFVFEYLKFIESTCGIGNTKTGYLSFNRGNKILEEYSKYCIEKYNIYLFPNEKRRKIIQKSKIIG